MRVAGCDQLLRTHYQQGICALDFFHGFRNCVLNGMALKSCSGYKVTDHFAVDRGLKNRAVLFKIAPDLNRVCQVSVVSHRKRTLFVAHNKRLSIFGHRSSGC